MHSAFPEVPGLDWFYGVGAHIGSYSAAYYGYYNSYGYSGDGYYDKHGKWHPSGYQSNYLSIGIDAIVGLEYQIEGKPLTIVADVKPYFDIIGGSSHYLDLAFSIRYIIK